MRFGDDRVGVATTAVLIGAPVEGAKGVVASPRTQDVGCPAAVEDVAAILAAQVVATVAASKLVIGRAPAEHVVSEASLEPVGGVAPRERIVA